MPWCLVLHDVLHMIFWWVIYWSRVLKENTGAYPLDMLAPAMFLGSMYLLTPMPYILKYTIRFQNKGIICWSVNMTVQGWTITLDTICDEILIAGRTLFLCNEFMQHEFIAFGQKHNWVWLCSKHVPSKYFLMYTTNRCDHQIGPPGW